MDYQKSTFEEFILFNIFQISVQMSNKNGTLSTAMERRNEGMKSVPTSNPRRGRR